MSESALRYQAQVIKDINDSVTLHDGQKAIAKSVFVDGKKIVFVECGRKFGKTSSIPYCAYRQCMSFPGSIVYIIGPFLKQMKEIIWVDGRLTHFLHKDVADKYVESRNGTELRIIFKNGSMIKCDGADNYEAFRGPNPHMVIYDEFKDHHPKFHEGMDPNLASNNAPLLIFGTPPETDDNLFVRMAEDAKVDPDAVWFNFPSWVNPHLDKNWLKKKKEQLIRRGEHDVWLREYCAKRVKGGHNAIFPMFERSKHVVEYETVLAEIRRYPKDWEYYYEFDPGSRSVFAGLAMVINKRTKKVVCVDEIYETDNRKQSTGKIYPTADVQMETIHGYRDNWMQGYDNAAAWFANEVLDQFDVNLMPCEKDVKTKNNKESMIKDMMNMGFFFATDKCKNLISEIENYVKDEKGDTKKCKDHLLDCISGEALITTAHGKIKMKDIKIGDYVLTRKGYKKVVDFWYVGKRNTIQINDLKCTGDHRVILKERVAFANDIRYGESLITESKDLSCLNQLLLMELLLEDTLNQKGEMTEFTLKQALVILKKALGIFTYIYTKEKTGRLKKAFTFIIKMEIHLIMICLILKKSKKESTCQSIRPSVPRKIQEKLNLILIKLGISLKSGTDQTMEESGTQNMVRRYGRAIARNTLASAISVVKNTLILAYLRMVDSARIIARVHTGDHLGLTTLYETVVFAEKNLKLTSTRTLNVAQENAQDVYDMTIDSESEFFADGILVHNCLRYGLNMASYDLTPDMTLTSVNEDKRYFTMDEERRNNEGAIEDLVDWLYE